MWKWIGRLTFLAIVLLAADYYSARTVHGRITTMQETLIAPTGQRIEVTRTLRKHPTAASIVSTEKVPFGYRVTYDLPTRANMTCTYRLPGIKCDDGWTVMWSQGLGRR